MKFGFVDEHRKAWPVRLMCEVLGLSASGYYAWRGRPESLRAASNRALLDDIRLIHHESCGTYGSPRVHAVLHGHGRRVGRSRVGRLMRHAGIRGLAALPRRTRTTDSRHGYPVAPNRLGRNFSAAHPNQVWLADLTYIPTGEGWLYLAAILDMHSRKVVGWCMRETQGAHFDRRDESTGRNPHNGDPQSVQNARPTFSPLYRHSLNRLLLLRVSLRKRRCRTSRPRVRNTTKPINTALPCRLESELHSRATASNSAPQRHRSPGEYLRSDTGETSDASLLITGRRGFGCGFGRAGGQFGRWDSGRRTVSDGRVGFGVWNVRMDLPVAVPHGCGVVDITAERLRLLVLRPLASPIARGVRGITAIRSRWPGLRRVGSRTALVCASLVACLRVAANWDAAGGVETSLVRALVAAGGTHAGRLAARVLASAASIG